MSRYVDLVVLWYRTAASVAWKPMIVGEDEVESERAKLRKRFNGRGGVETSVKAYVEVPLLKPRPLCGKCKKAYKTWGTAKKPLCPFCDGGVEG